LFTLGISIFTALLFGLVPAFTSTRISLAATLREGGRGGTAGTGKQALRRLLVVAEVGLSLVLVFAASLLIQTMAHLRHQDPGFRTDHLLMSHVFIPPARYPNPDAITRFTETFGDRVRSIPGVLDASITTGYPPSFQWKQMFTIPGQPMPRAADVPAAQFAGVDSRYLRTLGFPLLGGRDFSDTDTPQSQLVAVVNQEFVRRYFSGQEPVGRQIRPGPPPGVAAGPFSDFGASSRNITIIGVVGNFMNDGMVLPPAPHIFTLYRQFPGLNYGFKDIVVRTATNPESVAPAVAQVLKSLDADIPLGEVQSMETHMNSQTSDTRFTTALLGLFAGLGIVLAVIGIYGVVAYVVTQRTQEMGVRIALGASSMDILWLVLRYGLVIGLAGVGVGLCGAVVVRQSLAGLMYGVSVTDPITLAGAAAVLVIVTLTASAIPALRAMRIDAVQALRGE
jgi:predicted permease